MILPQNFYSRDTITVAKELLGKTLVKGVLSGIIVETEAYIGLEDKACHAGWRKRETCFPMWGKAGFTYVYMTYGMYYMLNIVTEREDFPAAVLIRAIEPINGLKSMIENRKTESIRNLTSGPGKLTQTLRVGKEHNNLDLTVGNKIYIQQTQKDLDFDIVETTRVGIDYAEEYKNKPWRFYVKDSDYVSKK